MAFRTRKNLYCKIGQYDHEAASIAPWTCISEAQSNHSRKQWPVTYTGCTHLLGEKST